MTDKPPDHLYDIERYTLMDKQLPTDKPLHVRVAEALGCAPRLVEGVGSHPWWRCECADRAHMEEREYGNDVLYRYDTDWSATGPLIERYGIGVFRERGVGQDVWQWHACLNAANCGETGEHSDIEACERYGSSGQVGTPFGEGPTPLLAVCNLILALKAAGKLEP